MAISRLYNFGNDYQTNYPIDDRKIDAELDQLVDEVNTKATLTQVINAIYPVGSIYISTLSTNPGTLFGVGTWVAFGAGRTLVGIDTNQSEFNTVEKTGGAKTHTLTTNEMPSHNHGVNDPTHRHQRLDPTSATGGNMCNAYWDYTTGSGQANTNTYSDYQSTGITIQYSGGGQAHNNLQPYIVVYMWKRTA